MVRGKVRRLTRDVLLVALVCLASTLAPHDASAASNGHERYFVLLREDRSKDASATSCVALDILTNEVMRLVL